MSCSVKVIIFAPTDIPAMEVEIKDGSVSRAVGDAIAAYVDYSTSNEVVVKQYRSGLEGALYFSREKVFEDKDAYVFVIITDLTPTNPARIERLIGHLAERGHFVALIPVAQHRGHNVELEVRLREGLPYSNSLDVVHPGDLPNPLVVHDRLEPWLKTLVD